MVSPLDGNLWRGKGEIWRSQVSLKNQGNRCHELHSAKPWQPFISIHHFNEKQHSFSDRNSKSSSNHFIRFENQIFAFNTEEHISPDRLASSSSTFFPMAARVSGDASRKSNNTIPTKNNYNNVNHHHHHHHYSSKANYGNTTAHDADTQIEGSFLACVLFSQCLALFHRQRCNAPPSNHLAFSGQWLTYIDS